MDVELDEDEARRLHEDPEFRTEVQALATVEPVYVYGPGNELLLHVAALEPNVGAVPIHRGAIGPVLPGGRPREGMRPVAAAERKEMLPRDAEGHVIDLERTRKMPSAWMSAQPHILYLREEAFALVKARPSALHFGSAAGEVPGLAAGSGATSEDIRRYPEHRKWECPAVLEVGPPHYGGARISVEKLLKTGKKTLAEGKCARAHGPGSPVHGGTDTSQSPQYGYGCRACWLDPRRYIYYHEH